MAATSSRKITPGAAENGKPAGPAPLLVITGEPEDERREVLFEVDGKQYTMLANPSASLMMTYMDMLREDNVNAAFSWAMEQMVDADGYEVLLHDRRVTMENFSRLGEVVIGTLLGADMRANGKGMVPKSRRNLQRR